MPNHFLTLTPAVETITDITLIDQSGDLLTNPGGFVSLTYFNGQDKTSLAAAIDDEGAGNSPAGTVSLRFAQSAPDGSNAAPGPFNRFLVVTVAGEDYAYGASPVAEPLPPPAPAGYVLRQLSAKHGLLSIDLDDGYVDLVDPNGRAVLQITKKL